MSKSLEETKAHIQTGALEAAHHISAMINVSAMITVPTSQKQPKISHADRIRAERNSQEQGHGIGGV
jgi:hypothetical protein